MNRTREAVLFIVLTLLGSWAIGWLWVRNPEQGWLTQWLMCTPALVGLSLSWLLHREPPRAIGLEYTGARPWLLAFLYPFFLVALAIALAYAVRAITAHRGFIYFQPEAVFTGGWLGLPRRRGLSLIWVNVLRNLWTISPWLLVALIYRLGWPEKLAARLPPPLRWLHHGLRALLAMFVVWSYPGPLAPPGAIGEEIGWRGTLVRRFADRPMIAFALTAPVWAAFHLPVVFAPAQAGHLLQNIVFLASIAAAAGPFAALYLASRSVWPCVVLHFTWNVWNPFFLGDVYGGRAGLFGGAIWAFNGEGLFGLLINGMVTAWLLLHWRANAHPSAAAVSSVAPIE